MGLVYSFRVMETKAVIDIGTNSVKLLVAQIQGKEVIPLHETGTQTRLGKGLKESGELDPVSVKKTIDCVRSYIAYATKEGVQNPSLIATSAVREAANGSSFIQELNQQIGFRTRILSGIEEGQFAFEGVMSTPGLDVNGPCIVVDLGGGSTELVVGYQKKPIFIRSYPLGTVRHFEMFHWNDPPSHEDWTAFHSSVSGMMESTMVRDIGSCLEKELSDKRILIGSGGALSILAKIFLQTDSYDRNALDGLYLSTGDLVGVRKKLWSMDLASRRKVPGLPANRADIILAGAGIFECMLEVLGCEGIRVSTRGLRFGYLLQENEAGSMNASDF